jgi:hypothetical protein
MPSTARQVGHRRGIKADAELKNDNRQANHDKPAVLVFNPKPAGVMWCGSSLL